MADFDPTTYGQLSNSAQAAQNQGAQFIFFSAQAANGMSAQFQAYGYKEFTFFIEGTGISTGATVKLQTQAPTGTWVDIDSRVIGATGNTIVPASGVFSAMRATISSRTDGTFNVSVLAR